jgi:hypothetical protein
MKFGYIIQKEKELNFMNKIIINFTIILFNIQNKVHC